MSEPTSAALCKFQCPECGQWLDLFASITGDLKVVVDTERVTTMLIAHISAAPEQHSRTVTITPDDEPSAALPGDPA